MSKGTVNKVILIGHTGKNPETKKTDKGTFCNFSLATTESWKVQGVSQERTEWHKCVAFGKLAELIDQYVEKGDKLYIEGRLQTTKWNDKTTGQEKQSTQIMVDVFQMLSGKKGNIQDKPQQQAMNDFHDDDIHF